MTIPKLDTCRQCGYSAEPDFIHNAATKHFEGHYLKCVRCGFQIETCADWYDAAVEWNRRASPWQPMETLPKDLRGRQFLLWDAEAGRAVAAERREDGWLDFGGTLWADWVFSKWALLPAHLAEGEKEEGK